MLFSQTKYISALSKLEFLSSTKIPSGLKVIIENLSYQRVRDDTTYHYSIRGLGCLLDNIETIVIDNSHKIISEVGLTGILKPDHLIRDIVDPIKEILSTKDIEYSCRRANKVLILYGEN
jgi:hypothetical protein